MKTSRLLLPLACIALVACSKSGEPSENPAESSPPAVTEIPAKAIAKAEEAVAAVEAKSAQAVAAVQSEFAETKAEVTKLYNDAVAKAKTYLEEKKFDQALGSLDSLKNVNLSADQQKIVDDLRAQITKAQDLYKQAQSTAKNLLGK